MEVAHESERWSSWNKEEEEEELDDKLPSDVYKMGFLHPII